MNIYSKNRPTQYWNDYCLHSIYGACDGAEFYSKVIEERERELVVESYPGQGMQEGTTTLRKCLIGSLYEVVEIPERFVIRQLSFDF